MQPRARGPNSFAQSKSASLQAVVLVATHEERADHPLQDLLPFQASFQVPTCGYLWWWFAAHTNLRFALPAYHPFHHEQL